jgi:hypothetical protein
MRLVWREVVRKQDPPRVIEYTCECEDIVDERWREGGLAYIRRTTRVDGVVQQVHETYRWHPRRRKTSGLPSSMVKLDKRTRRVASSGVPLCRV